MNWGIIVLCRFSSSRLPGKILRCINDKPVLEYILERLEIFGRGVVIVATSTDASDDPIESYCRDHGWKVYRGDLNNVAMRFLRCADEYCLNYAVRINGDNLFVDHNLIKKMITEIESNQYDLISNVKGRTFPIGMSVEIVRVSTFRELAPKFLEEKHNEHVTLYFYDHESEFKIKHIVNTEYSEASGLKLAIDTQADFDFATAIISGMTDSHVRYHLPEIMGIVRTL